MINIFELGKYDEWYACTNKNLLKHDTWNKLDRVIMIEQDLEWYNKRELAIDHFVQAHKISLDVNSFQERKISLIAINAGWSYHASKQLRTSTIM